MLQNGRNQQVEKMVKVKKQNIITKLPGAIGSTKGVKTIYDSWNCFFTNDMLDIIVNCTNKYIHSVRKSFERERDALITDSIEVKAFIGLIFLAATDKF